MGAQDSLMPDGRAVAVQARRNTHFVLQGTEGQALSHSRLGRVCSRRPVMQIAGRGGGSRAGTMAAWTEEMVARLSYCMTRGLDEYVATCEELLVKATGRSPEDALEGLRKVIEQYQTDWYMLERRREPSPSFLGRPAPQVPVDSGAAARAPRVVEASRSR
jgi:hypothetical protein